jgi:hypothetical protein
MSPEPFGNSRYSGVFWYFSCEVSQNQVVGKQHSAQQVYDEFGGWSG